MENKQVFIEPLAIKLCINYMYKGDGEWATLISENKNRFKAKFNEILYIENMPYTEVYISKNIHNLSEEEIKEVYRKQKDFFDKFISLAN